MQKFFATNACQISTSWTFSLGKIEQLEAMQLGQKKGSISGQEKRQAQVRMLH